MQRILSTAVIVGLLAATAAAFAITERLKLTKSPITATKVVHEYVSPRARTNAVLSIRFRRADLVTVSILDSHRHEVDTLAYRVRVPRARRTFTWNGRTDAGTVAPDGTYRMEVHFANQHRTILIPNPIVLESKLPAVLDAGVTPKAFSPDGDHQFDTVEIHYKLSEDAHAVVSLNGHRIIRSRSRKAKDKVSWGGKVDGKLLAPGTYMLTVGAVDLAGNVATKVQHVAVRLRYIAIAKPRVVVQAGGRLKVGVATDAKRYRWKLGVRSGNASGPVLKLRAPTSRGTYRLTVTERGHDAVATVVVR
ncbi:MAG TPA: FlgD immunoglobulin-like domain containing protein [Gaiellaceae bacterium]